MGIVGQYVVYSDDETFYEALAVFTEDEESSAYLNDIVYATDGATIEVLRWIWEKTRQSFAHQVLIFMSVFL